MSHVVPLSFLLALAGCVGDLTDLAPDRSLSDAAPPPAPAPVEPTADGGSPTVHFNPTIQADIDAEGCSIVGCHGGGAPMRLVAHPSSAADWMQNWQEFSAHASSGAQSPVLLKNLAGSGLSHGGGPHFTSTNDPVYVRWLAWITAGGPQ